MTEQVSLMGAGLYDGIPDTITISELPTASELDYVAADDFHEVMLTKILPKCIEEDFDPKKLFEFDYYWVLRCLRIMNYGPYVEVGRIFCANCNEYTDGPFQCDVTAVESKPVPPNVRDMLHISRNEFMNFQKDVDLKLLTIQDVLNSRKDKQFQDALGNHDSSFARLCYEITAIGGIPADPVSTRTTIKSELSPADYRILQAVSRELLDFGLRSGGKVRHTCTNCGSDDGRFFVFVDEQFFRPSLDSLREWRKNRDRREDDDLHGVKTK